MAFDPNSWDYTQNFGDSLAFDNTAFNANDLPFETVSDPMSGTGGQVLSKPQSSFWSNLGSGATNLFGKVIDAGLSAAPALLASQLDRNKPDPNAVGLAQRTTAQKLADSKSSMLPWVLGGAAALLVVVLLVLQLGKRKS